MPEAPVTPVGEKITGPRSQLGLYRAHLTSAAHRSFITVGRKELLNDTLEILRRNVGKKPSHHQLFIAPARLRQNPFSLANRGCDRGRAGAAGSL